MLKKRFFLFLLCICVSTQANTVGKRSKRQSETPCTLEHQDSRSVIECFQGTLDDINGDLIGDSAGDVGVVKMLSSSVPAIPAGAFQNFPSLAALTITGSGLSDIEQDSFTGIQGLMRLNLSFNEIDNLDQPIFTLIPELRRLNLTSNKIKTLQPNSFQGISKLQILDLSNNQIESIAAGVFRKCPNIGTIDLSGNSLTTLTPRMFFNLPSLSSVDLSRNQIAMLPGKLFDNVPNLSKIMLSQNNIRSINVEAFAQPLPKLTTLRVESNEIVYADVTPLSAKFPVLQKASISPNPWSCACFQDVRRWLKDKNVNYTTPDYNYFSGNRPVCVLLNEISRQTYTEEMENLQTFVGCVKPTEAVAKTIRQVYRRQLNKYNGRALS